MTWQDVKKDYDDFVSYFNMTIVIKRKSNNIRATLRRNFDELKDKMSGGCGNIVKTGIICPYEGAKGQPLYCKMCNKRFKDLDLMDLQIKMF